MENMQIELELEEKCSTVSYKCGKCPSEFVTEDELKTHCNNEHADLPPNEKCKEVNSECACAECHFKANDSAHLDLHMMSHAQKKDPVFNCGKCANVYKSFTDLAEHIDQQHKPPVLEMEPLQSCDLAEHIDQQHKPPVLEMVNPVELECLRSCDRCDFATEDADHLEDHFKKNIHNVHDINKSISEGVKKPVDVVKKPDDIAKKADDIAKKNTAIPDVVVMKPDSLVQKPDDLVTIPETLLECRKCSKEFSNKENLKKHIADDHIIVKVYNCTSCEHKTTSPQVLKLHAGKEHPTSKSQPLSIECKRCVFKSNDEDELNIHNQTEHMSTKVELNVVTSTPSTMTPLYVATMPTLPLLE